MLSVSDKYDSVNKRTQEISESMKLRIQPGCSKMPMNSSGNWLTVSKSLMSSKC